MKRSSMLVAMGAGLLAGLLANACTNDGAGGVTPGACDSIIDACHYKDDGSDEFINNCHANAHDGNDASCSADLQACLDACNAAPSVETTGYDGTHGFEESGHDHESTGATGATGGHDSSGGSSGHDDHGTASGGTTSSGTTAADDSSQASCDELGTICHDAADEFGMMCHDVGHAGDEAACAAIWVECLAHCNA